MGSVSRSVRYTHPAERGDSSSKGAVSLVEATLETPIPAQSEAARSGTARRTLSICIINPKFEPSYWGFDYALPLYPGDKRSTMMTGALPALAGLVPAGHRIVLLDENVE